MWSAHFRFFATRGRRASSSLAIPRDQSARKLTLELRFDDGEALGLDITHVVESRRAGHRKFRELLWLARAAGRRLRRGDIRGIARRALAQNYGAPSLDDLEHRGAPACRSSPAHPP